MSLTDTDGTDRFRRPHTPTARLVMEGVDITTVKELMGHKSITMTLRYSHLSPSRTRKAVKKLKGTLRTTVNAPEQVSEPTAPHYSTTATNPETLPPTSPP